MSEQQSEIQTVIQAEDLFGHRKIYKAIIEFIAHGDTVRITLFTQAPGFETARSVFNNTIYMTKDHGRIISIAEVNGSWVE